MPSFAGSGGPPQAKSTLGLDFDLKDINLILSTLPGEELEVKKSRQVKVLRGLYLVTILLFLPDWASSRKAATVGFTLNASPKAWDSPGLSSPAPLSLVWCRILSVSPVAVSRLRGWGRRRDEGMEWERGDGRPLGEKGRWTEEHCWEAGGGGGGGGSSRMDLSSSSCLRKCLFSPLRAFNWKKRERDICRRKTENNIILDTKPLWPWKKTDRKGKIEGSFMEVYTSHSFS